MNKNFFKEYKNYFLILVVFTVSILLSLIIQTNDFLKGVLALPAIASLLSVLYKIYNDNLQHERGKELLSKQQDFILGTASHMSEVAYDKHVLFCEEYIDRVQAGLQELYREGPSKSTMFIGRDLVNVRQKHSAWLTIEIETSLKPFEQALISIGAKHGLLESESLPVGELRNKVVKEVYGSFGLILGSEKPITEEDSDIQVDKTIEKIRNILGITILTKLRLKAVDVAINRLS